MRRARSARAERRCYYAPAKEPSDPVRAALLAALTFTAGACSVFVTPEGNLAVGQRGAGTNVGPNGLRDRAPESAPPPRPHIQRTAWDSWRPPPLGVLPPGTLLRNSAEAVTLQAEGLRATIRISDRLVPSWGGDVYFRIDLQAGSTSERPPRRDLGVVLDYRNREALPRAIRMASALFETLRDGDRGALMVTAEGGRTLVPLLSFGAGPLLMERLRDYQTPVVSADDLPYALQQAAITMSTRDTSRIRKLVVFTGSDAVVTGETVQWIDTATQDGLDVVFVPLSRGASARLAPLGQRTQATVLPEILPTDDAERQTIDELASLPEAEAVIHDARVLLESLPGPLQILEVAGAQSLWEPSSGVVPLGDVRRGDSRTVMVRATVPIWRAGEPYSAMLQLQYRSAQGTREVHRLFAAAFTGDQELYNSSRNGDVLQYVSLLNTLSSLQAAMVRGDQQGVDTLRDPALLQGRSLVTYAREHQDPWMGAQAELLLSLLGAPAPATPPPPPSGPPVRAAAAH